MFDFDKLTKLLKKGSVPPHMINRGIVGLREFTKPIDNLFNQQIPPNQGWNDNQIKFLLEILANMDSSNDPKAYRIGEREARISTPMLYDLTGGFSHGIGRSGNIKAPQPKACGASIINSLTDSMVTYLIKKLGLSNISGAITVPLSTGMSLSLTIRGLISKAKEEKSNSKSNYDINSKNEIVFPRMDHNSPIKAIELSGMNRKTIEGTTGTNLLKSDSVVKIKKYCAKYGMDAVYVPIEDIESAINAKTLGILSTTTFFPPRAPDRIKEIAKIAKNYNLIHIINNAYGIQSPEILKLLRSAIDAGRVDAIVQSTDKNFLTPVGGAIICSPNQENLEYIARSYAGRGSSAPILHLFVSLLSMGMEGYMNKIKEQQDNLKLLKMELQKVAKENNERVLDINNPIACAMSLNCLNDEQLEKFGGYLYNLRVTGPRVVNPRKKPFGPCCDHYPYPYLVMNAAIGAKKEDILGAIEQLRIVFKQIS